MDIKQKLSLLNFDVLTEYKGQNKPMTIQCQICKTIKECKRAYSCMVRKPVCSKCGIYPWQKFSLNSVQEICKNNNVDFLDDYYRGCNFKHQFRCSYGHIWMTTFRDINRRFNKDSNGCLICSRNKRKNNKTDVIKKLSDLEIEFIDKIYINNCYKHTLQCKKCLHVWKAATGLVSNGFSGCPKCKSRYNEKLTGKFLEELLPNVKINHSFFINEKIIRDKELIRNRIFVDYMINIDNKTIFVEYNGRHHYEPTDYSDTESGKNLNVKLKHQKIRDRWLRKYCKQNNIYLIEIDGRKYTGIKIKKYLENQLSYTLQY